MVRSSRGGGRNARLTRQHLKLARAPIGHHSSFVADSPEVHLNLNVRGMRNSATVAIEAQSEALHAQGLKIYKLGLGQSPFPVPEVVVQALRDNAHQKDYLPVRGLPALRTAVADYHRRRDDVERSGDDVLIGPGSKELIFLLQMVFYGDLVIPSPAWVSYAPQARIIGRRIRMLPTCAQTGWRLIPSQLEDLCALDPGRPRVLILNYPGNPTGGSYGLVALKELADVARRNKVVILSDEIYGELDHQGQHLSIARFYPEGTIISSELSKWCGAGGWRLGTFLFPPRMHWLLNAMASAASETFTSTSAPIQHAAVRAFTGGPEIEIYLRDSRRILRSLGNWCASKLLAAGVECASPEGGFYLFPDFEVLRGRLVKRGISCSQDLSDTLLRETGAAVLPGYEFGRPPEELTFRMAYVDFRGAPALEAAGRLDARESPDEGFLRQHCASVVTAVEAICAWVQDL